MKKGLLFCETNWDREKQRNKNAGSVNPPMKAFFAKHSGKAGLLFYENFAEAKLQKRF